MPSIFETLLQNIEIITAMLYVGISVMLFLYWRERKSRRRAQELAFKNEQISERLSNISKELSETSSQIAKSRLTFDDLDEGQKRSLIKIIENYENISEKSDYNIIIEINKENLDEFELGVNDEQ